MSFSRFLSRQKKFKFVCFFSALQDITELCMLTSVRSFSVVIMWGKFVKDVMFAFQLIFGDFRMILC